MADKHTQIMHQVITDWSVNRKGRLYMMQQGTFRHLYDEGVTRISPYPKKQKGFPDLCGIEFKNFHVYKNYQYKEIKVPVYCVVEVKTIAHPKLTPEQKNYLNYAASISAGAYVAMETEEGYSLDEWVIK